MKKGQLSIFAELTLGDTENFTAKVPRKFTGTDNPRQQRVITALMLRARRREELDRIAGASNSPELVADLRRRGLSIPCHRTPGIDSDGLPIRFGVYELTADDRRKITVWLRKRQRSAEGG